MQQKRARHSAPEFSLRRGAPSDVDALVRLEQQVFAGDRVSRRGFLRFMGSPRAVLLVAVEAADLAGYALVLFRQKSFVARLYSIAVAPHFAGRGIGVALLAAAEEAACERGRRVLRLEVHERNSRAIERYRKAGYVEFGRYANYYADRGHALRFEKRLVPRIGTLPHAPPYFHQTTEFTCGPACVMMALAWANPRLQPSPGLEFKLWREATTIFLGGGHGGCDPFGLALSLQRRGLDTEIYVSRAGPYFLDTVRSDDRRRVMRLTQQEFRRESVSLGIRTHLARASESVLMSAFDADAVAIVLVSGHGMVRRRVPHWVFAFGWQGQFVLIHDPAARGTDEIPAAARRRAVKAHAVSWPAFMQMTRFGREHLSATILVRKGSPQ
jgi:ribosomal protein S18 acetylase RimI-like enzyme